MSHWTNDVMINGKKIKVDRKIADLIVFLNNNKLPTKFCCQGDKENEGYIYFEDNVDMESALVYTKAYFPKAFCFIESLNPNIIRFYLTKRALENAWNAHNYIVRMKKRCFPRVLESTIRNLEIIKKHKEK